MKPLARILGAALLASLFALLPLQACGGSDPAPGGSDAGDGGSDGGSDAGDGGSDGGSDAGPQATLVEPSARPQRLAIDEFNVYWTDGNGKVVKRQLGPGGGSSDLAAATSTPYAIAAGADDVYFGGLQTGGGLWKVSKLGGTPVPLAAAEHYVQALAVDGSTLWYSSFATAGQGATAQIRSLPVTGGSPTTLVGSLNYARALVVDANAVYVASDALKKVVRSTKAVTTLATPGVLTLSLAQDDLYVYYGDRSTGTVHRVPKAGGGAPTLLASLGAEPSDVYLDASTGTLFVSLFATIGSGKYGAVYKVPAAGGAPVLVGSTSGISSFGASPLVADATTVYLSAGGLFTAPR